MAHSPPRSAPLVIRDARTVFGECRQRSQPVATSVEKVAGEIGLPLRTQVMGHAAHVGFIQQFQVAPPMGDDLPLHHPPPVLLGSGYSICLRCADPFRVQVGDGAMKVFAGPCAHAFQRDPLRQQQIGTRFQDVQGDALGSGFRSTPVDLVGSAEDAAAHFKQADVGEQAARSRPAASGSCKQCGRRRRAR